MQLPKVPQWVLERLQQSSEILHLVGIQHKALLRHRDQVTGDIRRAEASVKKRLEFMEGSLMGDFPAAIIPPTGDAFINDGINYAMDDDSPGFVRRDEEGWV